MKRHGLLLLLLGVACGDVDEKAACRTSLDCPTGEWCADAEGERRCWADAVPPVASDVTLTCDTTPCLRDGTMRVEAAVADDREVLSAEATLDLDPSRTITLTRSGARWGADVPLRDFPFERFEGPVTARVVGVDGAKTRSAAVDSGAVQVTRLRWEYTAASALTSPAVMADGTAVMGVAAATDQVLAVDHAGAKAWSAPAGSLGVTATPAVGERAIWVGSRDGTLTAVGTAGSALAGVGLAMGGAIDGSIGVVSLADKEWGFVTSASGRMGAASTIPGEYDITGASLPLSLGPVIDRSTRVCGVLASLRCYLFDGAFDVPTANDLPGAAAGALAIDAEDGIWAAVGDPGKLTRTMLGGASVVVAQLASSAFSDSIVIGPNGDVVVGDAANRLLRISPLGEVVWSTADLHDPVNAPLVMRAPSARFVGTTRGARMFAVADDGDLLWEGVLSSSGLRAPNIYTPPGQPPGAVLSTAYVSSASGKLYAVIVDGELDTSSPWPKAFHDPRNTNNAGTQP